VTRTSISPWDGVEGEGVPTCSVMPVIICVCPSVMREDPLELRVRMDGSKVVCRAVWCGRESGRVLDAVNLER